MKEDEENNMPFGRSRALTAVICLLLCDMSPRPLNYQTNHKERKPE